MLTYCLYAYLVGSLSGGIDDRNAKSQTGRGWDWKRPFAARAACVAPDDRPPDGRYSRALPGGRLLRLRSGVGRNRDLPLEDHLCRRRQRDFALPRLSDRRPRRAMQLSRNLLAAAQWRAADAGAARALHA